MKHSLPILLFAIAFCILSCSEKEEKPVVKPVPEIIVSDDIDRIWLTGKFPSKDQQSLTFEWTTTTEGITLENSDNAITYFSLPEGQDDKIAEIKLTVRTSTSVKETSQTIEVPGLTTVRSYGLGKTVQAERTNSVDYPWYLDQINSGTYSSVNCGPTVVTMAIKWADPSFIKTPVDARMMYRSGGGWWFTSDIINYLNLHEIDNYTLALTDMNLVREELDNGNIAILCLDMYYVTYSNISKYHYNKFYVTNAPEWGHFIVIKGYKEVDGILFFEAYDPNSWGSKYAGGELKGKDRYYKSSDLNTATNNWWDYVIIIPGGDDTSARKASAVDPGKIEHKSGR